jgi:hypothetical protein
MLGRYGLVLSPRWLRTQNLFCWCPRAPGWEQQRGPVFVLTECFVAVDSCVLSL